MSFDSERSSRSNSRNLKKNLKIQDSVRQKSRKSEPMTKR